MKVSVALCTYMGERFLEEQLESIFYQTHPIDEIFIGDDFSCDNTEKIIRNYQNKYPKVVHFNKNVQTLGSVKNFEQVIQKCTGDYIFLSDQDDIWPPDKVETICNLFLANPDADGVFSDAELIDESGSPLGGTLWESIGVSNKGSLIVRDEDLFKFILMLGNIAPGATMAIRSRALSYILPFRLSLNSQHDQSIALDLSGRNALLDAGRPLLKYRIHANQQVGTAVKEQWPVTLKIKDNIWNKGFSSVDPGIGIYKAWAYYNRAVVFCDSPETRPVVEEAILVLKEAKRAYLRNFNFFRRKRVLCNWYRNSLFLTTLSEVIFRRY